MVVPGDNAEGFLDGSVDDYQTSSVDRADCRVCRFTRSLVVDEETAQAIEMSVAVTSSFREREAAAPRRALLK